MAMMIASPCSEVMDALVRALGLEGLPLERIAVVCDVREPLRVYVKGLLTEDQATGLAGLFDRERIRVQVVEDVQVQPDCTVYVRGR